MSHADILKECEWIDQKDIIPKAVHINNSIKKAISLTEAAMLKKVERLLEQDIEHQKSQLVNNFEADKALKWRITGMEVIMKKLKELSAVKE